jgi:4'-phosphopantetheinyl transferase
VNVHEWLRYHSQNALTLHKDEIHVWRVCLDQPQFTFQYLAQTLSQDEQIRAKNYCFERDRRRFITGRGMLRLILSSYLQIDPIHVRFRYGDHGKPMLNDVFSADGLHFNLSHSEELALYAITTERSIGIDLEKAHPIPEVESIAKQFFSPSESATLSGLPAITKVEAFFNCWTRKEAYLKARGEGFARALDQFDVSMIPGEPAALLRVEGDSQEAARWSLRAITPAPGYVAALAVLGHDWKIVYWQWGEGSWTGRS